MSGLHGNALPAIAANLWLVGLPVWALAAATLVLLRRAPGRLRYGIALCGFAAAALVPPFATREAPAPVRAAIPTPPPRPGEVESGIPVPCPASIPLGTLLGPLWVAGAVLLLSRELRAHLRLAADRRRWSPAGEALRRSLEVAAGRALWLGDVESPRTHGLLRPAIVLPRQRGLGAPSIARLVVAHEEAHARWRDPLVHALLRLVRALLWISPALWLAERLVMREREAAADEAALRGQDDERCASYAAALVAFCRLAGSPAQPTGVHLGTASTLEYRVRRILRRSRRHAAQLTAAALILTSSVVALAATPLAEAPAAPGAAPAPHSLTSKAAAGEPPRFGLPSSLPPARAGTAALAPITSAVAPRHPTPGRALAASVTAGSGAAEAHELAAPLTPATGSAAERFARPVAVTTHSGTDEQRDVHVHRNVDVDRHLDVHRDIGLRRDVDVPGTGAVGEEELTSPGAPAGPRPSGPSRSVIATRLVLRTTAAEVRRPPAEEGRLRSLHPVALFHRAVTAPLKRWLRRHREPPQDAPGTGPAVP